MAGGITQIMWCDLRKPVTWWKIGILRFWYHVNYPLSRTFYLDLLWYLYQKFKKKVKMFKGYKNKEKQKNYVVNFLCFAISPLAICDRFSQITSHIMELRIWINKILKKGRILDIGPHQQHFCELGVNFLLFRYSFEHQWWIGDCLR